MVALAQADDYMENQLPVSGKGFVIRKQEKHKQEQEQADAGPAPVDEGDGTTPLGRYETPLNLLVNVSEMQNMMM